MGSSYFSEWLVQSSFSGSWWSAGGLWTRCLSCLQLGIAFFSAVQCTSAISARRFTSPHCRSRHLVFCSASFVRPLITTAPHLFRIYCISRRCGMLDIPCIPKAFRALRTLLKTLLRNIAPNILDSAPLQNGQTCIPHLIPSCHVWSVNVVAGCYYDKATYKLGGYCFSKREWNILRSVTVSARLARTTRAGSKSVKKSYQPSASDERYVGPVWKFCEKRDGTDKHGVRLLNVGRIIFLCMRSSHRSLAKYICGVTV